jgi:DNA polymerase I
LGHEKKMTRRQLDDFFTPAKPTAQAKDTSGAEIEEKPVESFIEAIKQERKARLHDFEAPHSLPLSYFVSATYDGNKCSAIIKLYEPKSKRIFFWHDTTGHKPYLLTNLSPIELEKMDRVTGHPGFDHFETLEKYDPLQDRNVALTKVVAKDPLAVGGRPTGCLRDIIPEEWAKSSLSEMQQAKVWEASIKYYQCYIYDRQIEPGMIYKVENGRLDAIEHERSEQTTSKIQTLFTGEPMEFLQPIETWARLLEYPAPEFRRVALDIEVFTPTVEIAGKLTFRVPDPREADYQVLCATLLGTDGKKRILLLNRPSVREGGEKIPADVSVEYFSSEEKLLEEIFDALWDYPFVVTFNGDDFDLRYLWHRAEKLGIRRNKVPIELGRKTCQLRYGVHIDLYKFFFNKALQIYAFGNKYRDVTLDEVGQALVGLKKIELTKGLNDLTYTELGAYCLRDAEIALNLTTFDDDLSMKLILAITRISRMPMEDVSRQGVSRWIRNFLQFEHRRRNMLIPNTDDILAVKGKTVTKAVIKGKRYKGAIVVEPTPGVHFNVAVMDFPSLYPSIIKVFNLGYQTILCPHEECRVNKVPGTTHWVCTKRKALESLLIGSLRDLRVKWYKPKAKDKSIGPELRSWYNVIQSALKVILNASYGVFGAETFDLFCPPVAEATASIGRDSITRIINEAEKLGIQVIYGDTDSIFLKNPSDSQINLLAKWSEKELHMELDVDKVYRYAVFSSRKKNYLGVAMEGTVDVKGLTGKKKHIPPFIKEAFDLMKNRLSRVKTPSEFEDAKKEIRNIIRDSYLKLKRREWKKIDDLAFNVVLGESLEHYTKTTPQHVKAADILKKRGYELKAGDLISFVKVVKEPHVKPVQLASNSEIDVDKYVGYLQSTFDQVLDALGLDFNEIIGLTKLERFM